MVQTLVQKPEQYLEPVLTAKSSLFIDKGFNDINLNANNYYDSPRLIASKVNEDERLDTLPGNKSLNVNLELSSVNPVYLQ